MTTAILKQIFSPLGELPGFVVPVFMVDGEQSIQVVDSSARVVFFSRRSPEGGPLGRPPGFASYLLERKEQALFALRDVDGSIVIGDRSHLASYLRPRISSFSAIPDLLYEIAQFLQDKQIIAGVSDRIFGYFGRPGFNDLADEFPSALESDYNFNMYVRFPEVYYKGGEFSHVNDASELDSLLAQVKEGRGAVVWTGSGDAEGWNFCELQTSLPRSQSRGVKLPYFIRYFSHDYSEAKAIYGGGLDAYWQMRIDASSVWYGFSDRLDGLVHCKMYG